MEHIIQLLYGFKYLFLFPLAVVEGPILAIIAGFLCMEGILNPFIVYPIIILGDIIGDSLVYALGRWGKSCSTGRWRRLMGLSGAKIERARTYFGNNPVKTVSLSKNYTRRRCSGDLSCRELAVAVPEVHRRLPGDIGGPVYSLPGDWLIVWASL